MSRNVFVFLIFIHTKITKLPSKGKMLFCINQGCFGIFTIYFLYNQVDENTT